MSISDPPRPQQRPPFDPPERHRRAVPQRTAVEHVPEIAPPVVREAVVEMPPIRTAVETIPEIARTPAPVRTAVVNLTRPRREAVTDLDLPTTPARRISAQELAALRDATPGTDGWFKTLCPAHADREPSLGFKAHRFGGILFHCFADCNPIVVERAMAEALGVDRTAFAPPSIVAQYEYHAADGALLYQVVRFEPKRFVQRRPDGRGHWEWNLKGVTPVPYRLPMLQGQPTVYVVEGEKDADTLAARGLAATCNSGGAGKWRTVHTDELKAAGVREVVILPDNDESGHKHAHEVATSCVIQNIQPKKVTLPGLPEKGDVSDWLDAGHTVDELQALVETQPSLTLPMLRAMDAQVRAETAPPPPLTLTSLADLFAEPDEELDWTVDGLCSTGGLSLLAGKPKVGKSTLTLALALAVARGTDWLSRATTQGTVWLLTLEEHRTALKQRLLTMGATAADPIFVATEAPRPLEPALEEQIADTHPALIVIDTLFRGLGVADSDNYALMVAALAPIQQVARASGAHVLLVHHMKKKEGEGGNALDDVLGSTAIAGGVDTILMLKKTREGTRVLASEGRYGTNLEACTLTLMPTGTVETGPAPAAPTVVRAKKLEQQIVEYLGLRRDAESHPLAVTDDDIQRAIGARRAPLLSALHKLVGEGAVVRTGGGVKGSPFHYSRRN